MLFDVILTILVVMYMLQGRLKYVATTNSDQLALVNAYNGWMHSQFTKAYADSHCLHMASLLMIKGWLLCCLEAQLTHECVVSILYNRLVKFLV